MMRRIVVAAALALALVFATASEAQYIRGPRGGCYTFSKSGRKRYVERSLCAGSASTGKSPTTSSKSAASEYHLGPRGGCYKISASGNRRYVDRSLCRK